MHGFHERPRDRVPGGERGMIDRTAGWIGEEAQLPAAFAANQRRVQAGFWKKFKRVASKLPFASDLAAAWFCAIDPVTPFRVRATLFGALAYFVMPFDVIPDFLVFAGFTDDASILLAAVTAVAVHIRPEHRQKADEAMKTMRQ
jgi:uncharacterized membrane protein YkvA (DUF1232 family)